jgi:ABC-type branched-subunit amino acid transport system substrate-binding protein
MINEQGGVNGRRLDFLSYDDAYSPPKTVEQVRRLVEGDEVLLLFNTAGTPTNSAIHKYVNAKHIPHLFVSSGATKWADPANFPWTMGFQPNYQSEARIYAKYILETYPAKTIGVLYQNDDFGKDYLLGLREGLGNKASTMIVAEVPFETTAPTIDTQIVQIKSLNPDIFINIATPKFAAQAIKKIGELDWKPVHILANVSSSISSVLRPAGLEKSEGILSSAYMKDPNDPQWATDPAMIEWRAFMDKYYPAGDKGDVQTIFGYAVAQAVVQVLKQCGDDLTRENVMKQAASLDFGIGVLLPGMRVKTSATEYSPLQQLQMMRFNGKTWELFGPLVSSEQR